MNTWDNRSTDHNRTISTGPTPDGTVRDLKITVAYVADGAGVTDKAIATDNHIIPLILRAPEMREVLRECVCHLNHLASFRDIEGWSNDSVNNLLATIRDLTRPTPQELYIQTGSYD